MGQKSAGARLFRDARIAAQKPLRGLLGLALVGFALAAPQTPPAPFDQAVAWGHLKTQVAFGPRVPETKGHLACRDYLLAELKKTTEDAAIVPFVHRWSRTGKPMRMWNVVGSQNWEKAETRVVLMAHWDTRPTADMEYDPADRDKPIPGANDGASGVAVLLELARAFKDKPVAGVGIQYVLVDGEDLGPGLDEMFLGARKYAASLPAKAPHYGILLDMVGDADLEIPKEPYSQEWAPKLMKDLYVHAAKIGLEKTFPNRRGPEIIDDHHPINEAGIPMIDLIDFTYPAWHTLADDVDKCSPSSLGKVGKLVETWLRANPTFRNAKG